MIDIDLMNHSELALLAQDHDPEAHRGLSRETLIGIIRLPPDVVDVVGPELPLRRVNKIRLNIMRYLIDHWTQVEPLLSCPAHTKDPRACFTCTDVQVVECAALNRNVFKETEK